MRNTLFLIFCVLSVVTCETDDTFGDTSDIGSTTNYNTGPYSLRNDARGINYPGQYNMLPADFLQYQQLLSNPALYQNPGIYETFGSNQQEVTESKNGLLSILGPALSVLSGTLKGVIGEERKSSRTVPVNTNIQTASFPFSFSPYDVLGSYPYPVTGQPNILTSGVINPFYSLLQTAGNLADYPINPFDPRGRSPFDSVSNIPGATTNVVEGVRKNANSLTNGLLPGTEQAANDVNSGENGGTDIDSTLNTGNGEDGGQSE